MSVSAEVQRTLVKSPPELWAELSDPVTLARHLGELGEIRIVRIEPERAVEWEAAAADGAETSGTVELEASGWGTRVTLSASRLVAAPPEPAATESETSEPAPEALAEVELAVAPEAIEPEPELAEPEPRPGFFARLFRRRRSEQTPLEPEPELALEAKPLAAVEIEEPTPAETSPPEPAHEEAAPEVDIAVELTELEAQTAAVLTGVLDRLGAAHHRPFSRA